MGIYNPGSGGAGALPAGSGSELQYRATANTFGAVTDSTVSGANVTLAGGLVVALNVEPLKVVFPGGATIDEPDDGEVRVQSSFRINTGARINNILYGVATLDFPNTLTLTSSELTITVTGAAVGDVVSLGVPNASIPGAGCSYFAWVSAADTVTVRFVNSSAGSLNPASGDFTVLVINSASA